MGYALVVAKRLVHMSRVPLGAECIDIDESMWAKWFEWAKKRAALMEAAYD